jgi:hypothetical protein
VSTPEAVRVIARYRLAESATLSEAVLSDLLHLIITAPLSGGDSPEAGGVTMTEPYAEIPWAASWPVTGEVLGSEEEADGCTVVKVRQHDGKVIKFRRAAVRKPHDEQGPPC